MDQAKRHKYLTYDKFVVAVAKWVEGKEIAASCPCGATSPPNRPAEEEVQVQVEVGEEVMEVDRVELVGEELPVLADPAVVGATLAAAAPAPAAREVVKVLENERVPFGESCKSGQAAKVKNVVDIACRHPVLQAAVLKNLAGKERKRSKEEEEQRHHHYFDPLLSCFNAREEVVQPNRQRLGPAARVGDRLHEEGQQPAGAAQQPGAGHLQGEAGAEGHHGDRQHRPHPPPVHPPAYHREDGPAAGPAGPPRPAGGRRHPRPLVEVGHGRPVW